VYRSVTCPVSFQQQLMVALVAAGMGAVASHGSAAWLWGLQPRPPARPSVTVLAERQPDLPGVDVYRMNGLNHLRVHLRSNFECTDPLRTLVDLAAVVTKQELAGAVDNALHAKLVTVEGIEAELGRRQARGRRGEVRVGAGGRFRVESGLPPPVMMEVDGFAYHWSPEAKTYDEARRTTYGYKGYSCSCTPGGTYASRAGVSAGEHGRR
jgi:hypothetical protein